MRTLIIAALLAVGLFAVPRLHAGSSILVGSMSTVNGTFNSPTNALGTFSYPGGRIAIQNGGLTDTNALVGKLQFSADGTNFITVAVYGPSSTNATTDTFIPSPAPVTIYYRFQVVTTNSVQVGATFLN
jgi:hypothetical protein